MIDKSDEEKKQIGDIESLIDLIKAAVKEQNTIIQASEKLFNVVLKGCNPSEGCDNEKCGYASNLALVLSEIKDSIVANNNELLDFNRRCDL